MARFLPGKSGQAPSPQASGALLLWAGCVLGALVQGVFGLNPTVHTPVGTVRGVRVALASGDYVDKYLAIPYAKPPVGDLRFKAPQAADRWTGTLDGTQMGAMCPQPPDSYLLPSQVSPQSEDCLLLNVYTPKVTHGGSVPVMVWIHGGGFALGSGGRFDWTMLAAQGVVVVAINYRLGSLGFLSMQDSVSPGNYGLQDQIQALRWVRDVISSFNGDPNDVTIFGESAGGASVALLVLSQQAKGLFHKAIAESGGSLNPFSMRYSGSSLDPLQDARELGRRLGCQDREVSSRLITCLRTTDLHQLMNVSFALRAEGRDFLPVPESMFGLRNGVFAGTPVEILRNGWFSNVPTIRGFNHDEMAIGMQGPSDRDYNVEKFTQKATSLMMPLLQPSPAISDVDGTVTQIINAYLPNPSAADPQEIRQAYLHLASDFVFSMPIIAELQMLTQHPNTVPQYMYRFDYRSANRMTPQWMGVMHTDEIPYVSGAPVLGVPAFPNYVTAWTDDDIHMSRDVMKMWSDFAKQSIPTPSPMNGTRWMPWSPSHRQLMSIGSSLRMLTDPLTPQQKLLLDILTRVYTGYADPVIG